MQHRVFKYPLQIEYRQLVHMPSSAQVIWVTEQNEKLVMYAQVEHPDHGPIEPRIFSVVTTGDVFQASHKVFVGACTLGGWFQAFVYEWSPNVGLNDVIDHRHEDDFQQIRAA